MIYSFQYPRNKHHMMPVLLRIIGISHLQEPVQRPKGISIYQWFYCAKGKGEIILNHQKSIISEGQCALIYAGEPHAYHALTSDWTVHFIGFSGPDCLRILGTLRMRESGIYHLSNKNLFLEHIQALNYLREREIKNKRAEFSKECYSFLIDLSSCINRINTAVPTQENEIIQSVINYMEEHYSSAVSLDDIAEQVQLSKEYLCTLFKRTMQQTIIQHLTGLRIAHARIFLGQYPEKKVSEIAKMCGFESPSYFGKIFKEMVGVTPETYRKNQ